MLRTSKLMNTINKYCKTVNIQFYNALGYCTVDHGKHICDC